MLNPFRHKACQIASSAGTRMSHSQPTASAACSSGSKNEEELAIAKNIRPSPQGVATYQAAIENGGERNHEGKEGGDRQRQTGTHSAKQDENCRCGKIYCTLD